jgi:hypothetical protein
MNKDRTGAVSTANALKMAIEALQNNQTYDWKGNPLTALDEANEKVINACKEALESQEIGDAEIRQMLNDIEYYQKRVEALEQPAQEPVAEVTSKTGADITMSWWHEPALPVGTKLYTHPAQPLSDDEIQKTWYNLYPLDENNLWTDMLEGEHLRKFARAIEQAHGIGEKDGQTHNSSNDWSVSGTCD